MFHFHFRTVIIIKKGPSDIHFLMQRGVQEKKNIIKNQGFYFHYYKSIVETNNDFTCLFIYISLYALNFS